MYLLNVSSRFFIQYMRLFSLNKNQNMKNNCFNIVKKKKMYTLICNFTGRFEEK